MNIFDLFSLDGKVAMETGVRHLGYDITDVLAEAGANLVITARRLETLNPLAEKLRRERGV